MKKVTSYDIINLAKAYQALAQNSKIPGEYSIDSYYWKDILKALNVATKKYIKEIEENG